MTRPIVPLGRSFFGCFLAAQAISLYGDRLNNFSLVALVNRFAAHPGRMLPLIYLAMYLPIFTLAPIAGALVDRASKGRVLVVTDCLRGILVMSLPFLFSATGGFAPVIGVVFLLAVGNLFFVPAKSALIPEIVPANGLVRANSILWTAGIAGTVAGFLSGGIIFDLLSWRVCFWLDGATYLVSAALMIGLARETERRRPLHAPVPLSLPRSIRGGLHLLRRSPGLRRPVGTQSILFFGAGGFSVIAVVLVGKVTPPGSSMGIAAAGLALGAGMGAGSWLAERISRARRNAAECLLFLLMGLASAIVYAARGLGCLVAGFAASPVVVIAEAEIQERAGQGLRATVISFREVLSRSLFLLSAFLFGIVGERVGERTLALALGLFLASAGCAWIGATRDAGRMSTEQRGGQDGDHGKDSA